MIEVIDLWQNVKRLGVENLGNRHDHSSAQMARTVKKRLPPSPCGHLLPLPCSVWPDAPETDTRTIDQAVRGEVGPIIRVFSIGP